MSKAMNGGDDRASSIIAGKIPLLQIPEKEEKKPKNLEAIDAYILAYYYSALTNLLCQAYLQSAQQTENDEVIQPIIQASQADFQMLDIYFDSCGSDEIWASPNSTLYEQIRNTWREQVKG